LSTFFSLKMTERSKAKSAKRSFASQIKIQEILTRSFASLNHLIEFQLDN
jgi:hypothetical protein